MALLPEDPQKRKVALYGALVTLVILAAWYFMVLEPGMQQIEAQRTHHQQLEQQTRLIAQEGLDDQEARETERVERQLDVVEGLIPSGEELPALLDQISAEATRAGVDLSLIRPAGISQEEHYTRRTYDLAALGSYHAIGDFLARIGSLSRIITPTDLQLQPAPARESDDPDAPRLEARFSIETYVADTAPQEETDDE